MNDHGALSTPRPYPAARDRLGTLSGFDRREPGGCRAVELPLIDAAQPVVPADFRQAALNVVFNLWFLASSVTAFALIQQAVQRRKHARSPYRWKAV